MLDLPSVTLICITGRDFKGHLDAINKSCEKINFGAVKIIYDLKIDTIEAWNYKIIYDLWKYVDTSHALLIHADGYIVCADLWNPDWLNYDYIGAPWPLPKDEYSYRDDEGKIQRIGNSVSLRSKSLMEAVAKRPEAEFWAIKEKYGNTNEDGFICCHNRTWLERIGYKFPSLETAKHFSKEHEISENKGLETFAFHSL